MTVRYLLDTNIVSHLLRGHPAVVSAVTGFAMEQLAMSAVTEGELLYGLAKRPGAVRLNAPWQSFCFVSRFSHGIVMLPKAMLRSDRNWKRKAVRLMPSIL